MMDVADIDTLYWFVQEREMMRKSDKYVSTSPILRNYRFCNIRRRDDRMTRWMLDNWFPLFTEDRWFASAIARCINWPPTLERLLPLDSNATGNDVWEMARRIDSMELDKKWGGAYMIRLAHRPGESKAKSFAHTLESMLNFAGEIREQDTVKGMVTVLSQANAFGTFMSGQVAADLSYLPELSGAADLYSWAPRGPGSQLGLNYLRGENLKKQWEEDEFNETLIALRNDVIVPAAGLPEDTITLHDCQNVMCEYSKFARTYVGHGHPKTKYKSHEGIY